MARILSNEVKVKMLENARGCLDGFTVSTYSKGMEYIIPRELADIFFGTKEAEEVKEAKAEVKEVKAERK